MIILYGLPLVKIVFCTLFLILGQCAVSGLVVDRGNFETRLTDMRLGRGKMFKVYHGGSKREIPLKEVNTILIDPTATLTVDNELYFSADITLKNNNRLKSLDKDQTVSTKAFISVQDAIIVRNKNENFSIGLDEVLRITVR